MHNGILGVIGFKVFEWCGWVGARVLVNDPGFRFAQVRGIEMMRKICISSDFFFTLSVSGAFQQQKNNHEANKEDRELQFTAITNVLRYLLIFYFFLRDNISLE